MAGIDRITSVTGTRIELHPLIDAPHAHDGQQQRRRREMPAHGSEAEDGEIDDVDPDDNGAYDDHGHLVHEHGVDPPPDIPHINIVV